jgi:hypothetical protein
LTNRSYSSAIHLWCSAWNLILFQSRRVTGLFVSVNLRPVEAERTIKSYTFSFTLCTCSLLLTCDVLPASQTHLNVSICHVFPCFPLQLFAQLYYPAPVLQRYIFTTSMCCSAIHHFESRRFCRYVLPSRAITVVVSGKCVSCDTFLSGF